MKKDETSPVTTIPNGIRTRSIVFPVAVLLAFIHFVVIVMVILGNKHSATITTILQDYGNYTADASTLMSGTMQLSETSGIYVMTPIRENGELNYGPIISYATEYAEDHRGKDVLARFEGYGVSERAVDKIRAAAASSDEMVKAQLHAIALMRTVYPLPDIPVYNVIPVYELTDEEKAMSPEQKQALATQLVYGGVYSDAKRSVNDNVNECIDILREEMQNKCLIEQHSLTITRTTLWILTMISIAILIVTFALFIYLLFLPLSKYVKRVSYGDSLDENTGIYEVRLLAAAYNGLKKRRDALEDALREAAENDALTNLPNRYSFNRALAKKGESGYPVAIFLFDINYLKQTNDELGHLAGDALICRSAECIVECFGNEFGTNCYRFGGDEFAVILKDITTKEIEEKISAFNELQKRRDASIAVGYEYIDDIGKSTLRDLFLKADRKMYENKTKMHEQDKKS